MWVFDLVDWSISTTIDELTFEKFPRGDGRFSRCVYLRDLCVPASGCGVWGVCACVCACVCVCLYINNYL